MAREAGLEIPGGMDGPREHVRGDLAACHEDFPFGIDEKRVDVVLPKAPSQDAAR